MTTPTDPYAALVLRGKRHDITALNPESINANFDQLFKDVHAIVVALRAGPRTGQVMGLESSLANLHVYPVEDYGAVGDGVRNDAAAIQAAVAAAAADGGGLVLLGPAVYALGTTTLTIPTGVNMVGQGSLTTLVYAGSGAAVLVATANFALLGHFSIQTTHDDAVGIEVGNGTRQSIFTCIGCQGTGVSSNNGSGFFLNNNGTTNGFSGGCIFEACYALGYKYAYHFTGGSNPTTETWTTTLFNNCYAVGLGAVAGSAGIYCDALSNTNGTTFQGGLFDYFEYGVLHENGGAGVSVINMEMEGNVHLYSVGQTFSGDIIIGNGSGPTLKQRTLGAAPPDAGFKERWLGGVLTQEHYYPPEYVVYTASSAPSEIVYYRGASIINGGSPTRAFAFSVNPPSTSAINYLEVAGHRMMWGSATPASGTYAKGDIVWNTGVAAGGSPGWVCTTAGSPGTWKAMAAVAA